MSIEERENSVLSHFTDLNGWEEKYKKIIKLGQSMPALCQEDKNDDNKVVGCQSQVWITVTRDDDGSLIFKGDSDALIAKGLVSLVLSFYSGLKPHEIIGAKPLFIEKMGLKSHLSPSRANGLYAMITKIKYYAIAFLALEKKDL